MSVYKQRSRFTDEQIERAVQLYRDHGPIVAADMLAGSDVPVSPSTLSRWASLRGAGRRPVAAPGTCPHCGGAPGTPGMG